MTKKTDKKSVKRNVKVDLKHKSKATQTVDAKKVLTKAEKGLKNKVKVSTGIDPKTGKGTHKVVTLKDGETIKEFMKRING